MGYTTILRKTGPTTLTKIWYENGTAVDAGDVNIAIVDAAGTVVVVTTAATKTGTGANTVYSYELAIQTTVKVLLVTWTRVDTGAIVEDIVEVVGGQLFTIAEARTFDAAALTSTTTYPTAAIAAERDRITHLLESWTGRSWVPRYCRTDLAGSGGLAVNLGARSSVARTSTGRRLDRPGRAHDVAVVLTANDGSTISTGSIVVDGSTLRLTSGVWQPATTADPLNVTVEYEYGLPFPDDGADRIGLLLLRDRLVKSPYPESALSVQSGNDAVQLVRAGGPMANRTRLPEVNTWIAGHRLIPVA